MSLSRLGGPRLRRPRPDAVTFGLVYLALAALPILDEVAPELASASSTVLPASAPGAVLPARAWFWVVIGMVAVGLVFAGLGSRTLPVGLPRRDAARVVGLAVVGPLLAWTVVLVAVHGATGTSVTRIAQLVYVPALTPGFVWGNAVVPGLLTGLGYGVLFNGAIQEHLRKRFTPREAVVALTVVAGLYRWIVDPVWTFARSNALLLVALVFIVGSGYAAVELSRMRDDQSLTAALTPTRVAVFALGGFMAFTLAVDVLSGATEPGDLLVAAAWFAVFAIAASLHERARSIWVPTLAVAVFQIAVLLTPLLEGALGLRLVG